MSRGSVGVLISEIAARIAELAKGETFVKLDETGDEPVFSEAELACYQYELPQSVLGSGKPEPQPFIVIREGNASETVSDGMFVIRLMVSIRFGENRTAADGHADMERVIDIVMKLIEDQNFTNWSLEEPIKHGPWDKDGGQPYPELLNYVDLPFMRQSAFNNT